MKRLPFPGKISQATDILTFLHGSEEAANIELKEYSSRIIDEEVIINKWALFKDRAIIKSFSIVFILSCVQPLLGYATVHYFLQPIFETAHTTISSELSSVILGEKLLFLATLMISYFFADLS